MNVVDTLKTLTQRHRTGRKPPFFAMLERRGVTYAELEHAIGAEAVPRAMRRCMHCAARYYCGLRVAGCPNAALFTAAVKGKSRPAA